MSSFDSETAQLRRVFVIAEAGVNHNGDINLAKRLVEVAHAAGADAVKFQTFKAEALVTRGAEKAAYQKVTTGKVESQFDMIKKLELSHGEFRELKSWCDATGILFLSTPFDPESVDFLAPFVPLYKIGSGDATNLPLLRHVAAKGKPVILSTGMCTLGDVEEAVGALRAVPLTLLHCVSSYPANWDEVNLSAMLTLKAAFGLPVGYSDHTLGLEVPVAAVAIGACVIEKHLTLDRSMPGPDHAASAEPDELKALVQAIRHVEHALGDATKGPSASELDIRKAARRSLVAAADIEVGTVIKASHVAVKRPGTGISPSFHEVIVGMRTTKAIMKDEQLRWECFK